MEPEVANAASDPGVGQAAGDAPAPQKSGKKRPGRPPSHVGCQVCGADVSGCRSFHQRYHICEDHMAADIVMRNGVPMRFCQQCGRFHTLDLFSPGMHSCREQLARHAARRRRMRALAAAGAGSSSRRRAQAGAGSAASAPQLADPPSYGTAAAAANHSRSALAQPFSVAGQISPDAAPSPLSHPTSPLCKTEPQGLPLGGSSGSSVSTHSTHQHSASVAEQEQQEPASSGQALPSDSCGGMDALLAAAEEEEELEQQSHLAQLQAAKRQRSEHPSKRQQSAPLEPDPSWFAAPPTVAAPTAATTARTAAALPAASQQATTDGWLHPSLAQLAQGSVVLPAHALVAHALPAEASAVLPPLGNSVARPPLLPQHHNPQQAPPAAVPNLGMLLQHLVAAQAAAAAPAQPHPALGAGLPSGSHLAHIAAVLQLAAAQQASIAQAQQQAQLQQQQLLLLARERERDQQQQEQQVAGLFKAAVEGLMGTMASLHGGLPKTS